MEYNAMGLNVGVSGRKRRLSSDDDETPIKQQEAVVDENVNTSSRESTPRIILGKSGRSKRVLSSESSDNSESSGYESEKSGDNSQLHSSDSSSDISSDEESEDESDSDSDSSLPARNKKRLVKKESSTPARSKHIKVENKQTRRTSTGTRASSSAKSSSGKNLKSKSKEKTTVKSNLKAAVQKKRVSKEKLSNSNDEDSDEEETTAYVPRRDRDHKQILVSAILCRWWHVLPDWPPPDTDYQALLKEKNLRLVSIDDWEEAPDVDEYGFSKVYQLSEYIGVFRDSKGNAHDLRPKENKPCYSNLIKMEEDKLYELLVIALENQIKTLETESPGDSKLINGLKVELVEAQALLSRKVLNKKK